MQDEEQEKLIQAVLDSVKACRDAGIEVDLRSFRLPGEIHPSIFHFVMAIE